MERQDRLIEAASESAVSAFSLFGGQALATLIAGLSSIALARLLGPEGYGRYSMASAAASLWVLATDFGASAALTRGVARLSAEGSPPSPLVGLAARFSLLTSLAALAAGFALAEQVSALLFNRPELAPLARIALPIVVFSSLFNVSFAALLGLSDAVALALLPVVRDLVRGLASPLLALRYGCEGALAGLVVGHASAALAGAALLRRRVRGSSSAPWSELPPLLRYGLPLYSSTALASALALYQSSVVAWVASDEEIGNLKVAGNFVALIQLLAYPIASALFPTFSKLRGSEAGGALRYAAKYSALVLAPAGAFAAAASRDLVRLIYGGAYALAPAYLSIQAISFLWSGLGSVVLASFFKGVGETRVVLEATLAGALAFVPLSLALAPALGVYGVLASVLASGLASTLYSAREALKRGASIDARAAALICAASLAAAAPVALLSRLPIYYPARLALSAAAYLCLYGFLLPVAGCISRSDISALRAAFTSKPLRAVAEPLLKLEELISAAVRGAS